MVEVLATRFLGASRVALLACMCVDVLQNASLC